MSAPRDLTQARAIRVATIMVIAVYVVVGVGLAIARWGVEANDVPGLDLELDAGQAAEILGLLGTLTIAVFVALISSLDGQGGVVGSQRHQLTFLTVLTALMMLTAAAGVAPVMDGLIDGPALAIDSLLILGASIVLAYLASLAWSAVPASTSIEHAAGTERRRSAQVTRSLERLGQNRARWHSVVGWSAALVIVPPAILAAPFLDSWRELVPTTTALMTITAPPTIGFVLLMVAFARSSWSVAAMLSIILVIWGLVSIIILGGVSRGPNHVLTIGSWVAATSSFFVIALIGSRPRRGILDIVRVTLLISERIVDGSGQIDRLGNTLSRPGRRTVKQLLWLLGRTPDREDESTEGPDEAAERR